MKAKICISSSYSIFRENHTFYKYGDLMDNSSNVLFKAEGQLVGAEHPDN